MPHRPDAHVISDKALSKVMQIWSECGWACEVVQQDYGDDLLVQTHYKGTVDESRIWVQVKGTRDIKRFQSKKHGHSLLVSTEHALRWVRSADLAVVVLWDVDGGWGLWSIPKERMDEFGVRLLEARNWRIVFDNESVFNKEAAIQLGWTSRLHHYRRLLGEAWVRDRDSLLREGRRDADDKSLVPLVAYDFLRLLGVLHEDHLDPIYLKYYNNARIRLRKEFIDASEGRINGMAITLSVLARLKDIAGIGVSPALLEACVTTIELIPRDFLRFGEKKPKSSRDGGLQC